jgi:hypothetical protein
MDDGRGRLKMATGRRKTKDGRRQAEDGSQQMADCIRYQNKKAGPDGTGSCKGWLPK